MKRYTRWFFSVLLSLVVSFPVTISAQQATELEVLFPVTPGLESAVGFWKKIFTEYSLSQLIFFDPVDMSRVYEVIEAGEGNRPQSYIDGERARIAATYGVDLERIQAQRGVKERMLTGLKRSGRYMQHIEKVFREKNLPVELGYLPLVESSFEIGARSFAGATGMWQFMLVTGKEYGLRIDRAIDERRDPFESTRAAAALLNQNYQTLGSWPLALTAYNYGAGGIARAVAERQSDDLVELIRDYSHPYWGFAPKNFYAEFLAAVDVAKNIDQYFPGTELDAPLAVQEIELKKSVSLGVLAKNTRLTHSELLGWNPALSAQTRSIPAGYRVKVPLDSKTDPIIQVSQTRVQEQPEVLRHRVKRGETLMQIARRYGASIDRIMQMNGMRKSQPLQVGSMLLIPKA